MKRQRKHHGPMPWFSCYPTDFLGDVGHLGNTELGIYWRLLLIYYRDRRPLPCDTDKLRRLAMAMSPEEWKILDAVMLEFFQADAEPDGTRIWRHLRADSEIEIAIKLHESRWKGAAITNAVKQSKHRERGKNNRLALIAERDAQRTLSGTLSGTLSETQPQPQPQPQKEEDQKTARSDLQLPGIPPPPAPTPTVGTDCWDLGVKVLTGTGLGPVMARSYIGSLCKTWDEETVLDAIRASMGKADPKAYMRKWLDDKPKRGEKPAVKERGFVAPA